MSTASVSVAVAAGGPAVDPCDLMAVVARYQGPLLRYVGRMLQGLDPEAEDVVQEVFVRLHRQVSAHGAGSIRNLTTWLFRVAHNLTIDAVRRRARRKPVNEAVLSGEPACSETVADEIDALSEALRREARQVALQELGRLDEPFRQVVLLKIIQGMTLREVAEVAGVSVSLVNYRLNRALTELSQRLRRAGVL